MMMMMFGLVQPSCGILWDLITPEFKDKLKNLQIVQNGVQNNAQESVQDYVQKDSQKKCTE